MTPAHATPRSRGWLGFPARPALVLVPLALAALASTGPALACHGGPLDEKRKKLSYADPLRSTKLTARAIQDAGHNCERLRNEMNRVAPRSGRAQSAAPSGPRESELRTALGQRCAETCEIVSKSNILLIEIGDLMGMHAYVSCLGVQKHGKCRANSVYRDQANAKAQEIAVMKTSAESILHRALVARNSLIALLKLRPCPPDPKGRKPFYVFCPQAPVTTFGATARPGPNDEVRRVPVAPPPPPKPLKVTVPVTIANPHPDLTGVRISCTALYRAPGGRDLPGATKSRTRAFGRGAAPGQFSAVLEFPKTLTRTAPNRLTLRIARLKCWASGRTATAAYRPFRECSASFGGPGFHCVQSEQLVDFWVTVR